MKLPIALVLLAVGTALLIVGINASDSFASDVSRFFTGQPTDRSIWFISGGIAAIVAGFGVILVPSSKLKKA